METSGPSSWSAAPSLAGASPGRPSCPLLRCLIPFESLHPPPQPGFLVHLQSQCCHSSPSCASCASYVSFLSCVSFPSSSSFSLHCHQHLNSCLGTDCLNHCWLFWLVAETHWLSEMVRGRQMQGPDVSELLVEGTQIWTWRMLSSWAGDLEMVSGCCVALVCGTLCGWVCRCVRGTAVFAG